MTSPQLSRASALSCIPVRNPNIREHRLDSGEILLIYTETYKPWFVGILQRIKKESEFQRSRKLQLDVLGSVVWNLIDDKATVLEIIASFAELHMLYPKEAEVSVIQFLRDLGKRGIIGMKQISE
jgi:hypothetical protein